MKLEKDDIILFNGDSITDCGRDRDDEFSLSGYSKIVANTLNLYAPEKGVKVYNRGISGDTSGDLFARLEGELAAIKPTILSVLIGINDTWRRFDTGRPTSSALFANNIEGILKIAAKYVKKVLILEPFLIPTDPNMQIFREDLDPKIQVLRQKAAKFNATYIALDGIFAEKSIEFCPEIYSEDSVHPTLKGHALIAQTILSKLDIFNA